MAYFRFHFIKHAYKWQPNIKIFVEDCHAVYLKDCVLNSHPLLDSIFKKFMLLSRKRYMQSSVTCVG